MGSVDPDMYLSVLESINQLLAFGLLKSEGLTLWFQLTMIMNIYVFIIVQCIALIRVSIIRADYGEDLALYLLQDLFKGAACSFIVFVSPLALYFYGRALKDALTATFKTDQAGSE